MADEPTNNGLDNGPVNDSGDEQHLPDGSLEPLSPQEADNTDYGLMVGQRVQPIDLQDEMRQSYLSYALSVIVERALPDVRDGMKPVHRRVVYAMYDGGYRPDRGYNKCSRVVGDVMGKYHPHGDSAIYDTLVRMAQSWSMRYLLVDGQGNFGSPGDDPAAAMRYTECRMAPLAMEMVRDIDKDTVDFVPNYDGKTQEPTVLPARFPNLLVNGSSGIAVGMATNIPPHNMREVADGVHWALDHPEASREELLDALIERIKGPDFPTGATILGHKGIEQAYRTGRGLITMRAVVNTEEIKGRMCLVVTELPYQVNPDRLVASIREAVRDGKITGIADMRDETDLNGLKITIDLKRGTDPDKLMAKLFRSTTLQDSFSCNFNILIAGMPRVMGVREILDEWTGWRMEGVRRRTYFVMKKKQDKLHLLRGLKKILLDIDRAIKIIRETEEDDQVVPNLMIGFGIDDVQAEYVADIKLRNINKEYILKRIEEVAGLEEEIADLQDIVNNPGRIKKLIVAELQAVQKKYAVPRRTEIVYEYQTAAAEDAEDETPDYPVHVFCSWEGYFKKITPQSLRMSGEQKYKEGDGPWLQWEASNRDELLVFTDRQQCYKARLSDFDDSKASLLGDFLPTKLGMDPGEGFVWACVTADYSGHLLFFFENGKVARVALSAYQTQTRRKKLTGAYSDKSPLAAACLLTEDTEMAVTSTEGRAVVFHTAALTPKTTRSTQGVNVMTLKPKYKVADARPLADTTIVNAARYRARSLPIAGMLLRPEDRAEEQMTLLE